MIISTMHQPHNKEVQHLSYDRLSTLCGCDCGNFIFIVKVRTDHFVPGRGVCEQCAEKIDG